MRVCAEPDCTTLTTTTRCAEHTRQREQARGTRQQRGYNKAHDQARRHLITQLPLPCAYGCGTIIHTARDLHAAHIVDGDPTRGWQASCPPCNRRHRVG